MAGIYIHIPFCKQACHYCDFHFSTKLQNRSRVIEAICKEILLRKDYLPDEKIDSIYFGGGTPSLLLADELNAIFNLIFQHFNVHEKAEITLEANPDDLNRSKLLELEKSPINRLSIGVQSFHEQELRAMNRAHTSKEALASIRESQNRGFENLSIDLIFGSPNSSMKSWEENLNQFFALNVSHLSAYSLTVEPKTALAHQIKTGQVKPLEDGLAYEQYQALRNRINQEGFEQYELSNYSKPGQFSKHNSSYWKQKAYLGIGPSAHSYTNNSRQWNVANNQSYVKAIQQGLPYFEKEALSERDRYNELLITRMRTKWGIELKELNLLFSTSIQKHFRKKWTLLDEKWCKKSNDILLVHSENWFQSDEVIRQFWLD